MKSVSIIIPSRLAICAGTSGLFLQQAIRSVRSQTIGKLLALKVIVGIDEGTHIPEVFDGDADVRFAFSLGRSQAAALNAAARLIDGDYVAFLEDDDQWRPQFLEVALSALAHAGFVSSTQLEVSEDAKPIRIFEFPTPSGWFMPRHTWEAVGGFDPRYRWHLDNEWLGRLNETKIARIHLYEASAPAAPDQLIKERPELANILRFGGPSIRLARHRLPYPLVTRSVHSGSGIHQIKTNPIIRSQSDVEYLRLQRRFGRIPW